MAQAAVVGVPQSAQVGLDGTAVGTYPFGIDLEGDGDNGVVAQVLEPREHAYLPRDAVVGIGRLGEEGAVLHADAGVVGDDDPVHRLDGLEQRGVGGRIVAFLEVDVEEDIAVVVGLLGYREEPEELLPVGNHDIAHGHAFLLEPDELLVVAHVDEEQAVGHVFYLIAEEFPRIVDLRQGGIVAGERMAGIAKEVGKHDDNQTEPCGNTENPPVFPQFLHHVVPKALHRLLHHHNSLLSRMTFALELSIRLMVLPTSAL